MLNKSLARDLAPDVRVNAIAPGAILWPDRDADEAAQSAMLARTPLPRLGSTDDVAAADSWLLDEASYVTGQTLHVDGGRHLG